MLWRNSPACTFRFRVAFFATMYLRLGSRSVMLIFIQINSLHNRFCVVVLVCTFNHVAINHVAIIKNSDVIKHCHNLISAYCNYSYIAIVDESTITHCSHSMHIQMNFPAWLQRAAAISSRKLRVMHDFGRTCTWRCEYSYSAGVWRAILYQLHSLQFTWYHHHCPLSILQCT